MDSTQIKTSRKRRVRTKNKNRIDRITEEDRLLKLHDKAQEMTYQLEEDKKKRDMRGIAATNIQKNVRGMQTRKRHPPRDRPLDADLIERITNIDVMGGDHIRFINELDELISNKENADESMESFDPVKYRIGEQYVFPQRKIYIGIGSDISHRTMPFLSDEIIQEETLKKLVKNKNREALLDIHRKEFELISSRGPEIDGIVEPYPIIEKVDEEILEGNYIPEFLYNKNISPEQKLSQQDEWEKTLQSLYGEEQIPILDPLDELDYSRINEKIYPHSEEKIDELEEYYKKYHDLQVTQRLFDKDHRIIDPVGGEQQEYNGEKIVPIDEVLMEAIRYYEGPTIYSCSKIKGQAETNKKLFNDKSYLNTMIRPCSGNLLLTEVYISNFERLPPDFILSTNRSHLLHSLESVVRSTRLLAEYEYGHGPWKSDSIYFPESFSEEIIIILESMGLYKPNINFEPVTRQWGSSTRRYYKLECANTLYMLAILFKFMKKGEEVYIEPQELSLDRFYFNTNFGIYIPPMDLSGIDALKIFLNSLEDYYNRISTGTDYPSFDIEKTKRYFILLLIGIVTEDHEKNMDYRESLNALHDRINGKISGAYTEIMRYYEGLPDLKSWAYPNPYSEEGLIDVKYNYSPKEIATFRIILKKNSWKIHLVKELKELHTYFWNKQDSYFNPYSEYNHKVDVDTLFQRNTHWHNTDWRID